MYKKFKAIKPFYLKGNQIPADTTITLYETRIYMNDVQVAPIYYHALANLLKEEMKEPKVLKEIACPNNFI